MTKTRIALQLMLSTAQAQQSSVELYRAASRNDKTALQLLRMRAEQGDANAQYHMGTLYKNGEGVPKDSAQAVKWYSRAAERGDAYAESDLGTMYLYGEGVSKD